MIGSFPFQVEKGWAKTVAKRFRSMITFDEIRVMQLLENVQYGAIYFVLGFVTGTGLDTLFPKFDEKEPLSDVILQVVGQAISMILVIFYIKKIAKLVPFLFVLNWDLNGDGKIPAYRPYESYEYGGNIMIGLVLIGSQFNFLKKIDLISRVIYSKYMGLEVRAESKM
jgi:hypothetical protein